MVGEWGRSARGASHASALPGRLTGPQGTGALSRAPSGVCREASPFSALPSSPCGRLGAWGT